jgi:hypothetical protein
VSNEKGVSEDIIFEAIESALAMATKKRYDEDADIEVTIDRETGDYETVRRWLVVPDDELALLGTQFTTEEAARKTRSLKPGDIHEEKVENVEFGRIAAQTAKQVIVQKVRDAERAQVVEAYEGRVGELVAGTVKKVTRDNVIVDLGNNAEGLLPRDQLVGRETFRINDRVRAILTAISTESPGAAADPQPRLSGDADRAVQDRGAGDIRGGYPDQAAPPGTRGRARRSRSRPMTSASTPSAPAWACVARACRRSPMSSTTSAWISCSGTTTWRSW